MATERKELDLIIKAAVQGGRSVDEIVKSVTKLEDILEQLTVSAKKGDASLDELRATLLALKDAQNQLTSQSKLISQFEKMATEIAKVEAKLAAASQKFAEYNEKIGKTGVVTAAQTDKLNNLGRAVERNQTILTKYRSDHEALGTTLRKSGVDLDNIAGAQTTLQSAYLRTATAANATQLAINEYAENIRKARAAEKAFTEEQAFQRKLQDAAQLVKTSEYERFWIESLEKADLAQQQNKLSEALRKTADQAIAAARGYQTLGNAAKSLKSTTASLSGTINTILNPTAAARATGSGVDAEIKSLAAGIAAIKGPIADYRAQVTQLIDVQKALAKQAGLVDAYREQVEAVRQARAELARKRAEVQQYANALKAGAISNDEFEAKVKGAQAAVVAAARNLRGQSASARQAQQAMREAGLATQNLAATQERLTASARASATAMQNLRAAHKQYGDEVRNSATAHGFFDSSGRTTLSLLQRIRGEVLSLIAAYAGIYGAISGARSAIDAFNDRQVTQNRLAVAVGDNVQRIGEEYEYIRGQAERVGLDFEKTADSYSRFAVAATKAGATVQETRFIFESFAEAGTVLGVNADRMRLVFSAIEQMMSKGKVSAEELRQQLGEHLPGAFELFQQAVKDRFPDLNAALKEGKISAAEILNFAQQYRDLVASRLPQATQSLIAQQNRFNTALYDFKLAVADSGFIDSFREMLERLTVFFRSDDGKKFAEGLSKALMLVVDAFTWLVENAQTVKTLLLWLGAAYGAKAILGLGNAAVTAAGQFGTLTTAITTADKARVLLMKGFLAFQSFIAGFAIGTWLYDNVKLVRQFAQTVIAILDAGWHVVIASAKVIWAELPNILMDALATAGNAATSLFRTILQGFAAAARAIGKGDLAASIDKAVDALTFGTGRIGNASADLRQQLGEDLHRIKGIAEDIWAESQNPGATPPAAPGTTANPGQSGIAPVPSTDAAEAQLRLKEAIEAELAALNAKIERNEKESLESRLKAIDDSYFRLERKIRELGGADGAAFGQQLAGIIAQLKLQETKKFNDALLDEQQQLQRKLEQVDAQAGRKQDTDLQARLNAVSLAYEQTYREIAEFREKLVLNNRDTAPADLAKQRLDAGVLQLQQLERQNYYEDQVNALLEERKAKLDTILVMEKTGLLTATQARERSAQVVAETQPKIEALSAEALTFIETMISAAEAIGANTTALEVLRAKIIEARESAIGLRTEFLSAAQVNEMIASGATRAFDSLSKGIGDAIVGIGTWKDALIGARNAFLNFAADFLMQIAQMIIKQQLLNALQNSSGAGGTIANAVNALVKHSGGVVGAGGPSRYAPSEWFNNAPRYHGGGIAGLAPNEYPAILKKNEEVLADNDPRNVMNGGGGAQRGDIKIMNFIDANDVANQALSSPATDKVFLNKIASNRSSIKVALGI